MELIKLDWADAKPYCEKLYKDNPYLSPYQDFSFLDTIRKSSNIHKLLEWIETKNVTFAAKEGNDIICIIPLSVNSKKKEINILGHLCSVGHLDFIYNSNLSLEDFSSILSLLGDKYKGFVLRLDRISQYSLTNKYLSEKGVKPVDKSICVKIDFDTYDGWYKSLSKNCRQNIRTAYNRINREEKELEVNVVIGERPSTKMKDDNLELLSKRTIEHNKKSSLIYPLMRLLKGNEAFSKALLSSSRFIGANIYLDKECIAICNGLIANDGRAIITRLSIDTNYGVYCPGGIIINELIKTSIESPINIKSIDLSRGDEKYKYTYGGVEHYNYEYIIKL